MRLRDTGPVDGLTPRQLQVLRLIADFHDNRCYSPTIAELASALNLSRSTIFEHIAELQRKGLLSTSPGRARSLRLTSRGHALLSAGDRDDSGLCESRHMGVPLLGTVAAGVPLEAVENEESLSLDSCFGMGGDLFALEVSGDSMIEKDIRPGDYVICRRSETAENGDIVVALVDEREATLKQFYRENESIRLQPANSNYPPIRSNNCRIEAVVIGLLRRF